MMEAIAWTLSGPPYHGAQTFLSRWHIRDRARPTITACGVTIPDRDILTETRDPADYLRDPRVCATCGRKVRKEAQP
jgi:hypothetical protein